MRYTLCARRDGLEQHQDVVRRPCDDEGEQDGGEGLGGLRLLPLLLRLLLLVKRRLLLLLFARRQHRFSRNYLGI